VEVKLVDDLDGSAAQETVAFAVDGVVYEIDLNARHVKELRSTLESYVSAARRLGRSTRVAGGRPGGSSGRGRVNNQVIRDWAKQQKIDLADRGRIPREVVARYEAESQR
jgi:hypothetical protein